MNAPNVLGTTVATVLLLAAAVSAEPSRAVKAEVDQAVFAPLIQGKPASMPRAEVKGLTHPEAKVLSLTMGGQELLLAIDATDPQGEPNLALLTIGDRPDFRQARRLTVHRTIVDGSYVLLLLEPVTLDLRVDGRTLPLTVQPIASCDRKWKHGVAAAQIVSAVQATCRIGDRTLPVRIVDGTADHRYADPSANRPRLAPFPVGDTILVAGNSGRFDDPSRQVFVGQPVFVNGRWYRVDVAPDGTTIDVRPTEVRAGRLALPHRQWSMIVQRGDEYLHLAGDNQPVHVPAEEYRIAGYRQQVGRDDQKQAWVLAAYFGPSANDQPTLTIEPEATTSPAVGTPLTGRLRVQVEPGTVRFGVAEVHTADKLMVVMLITSRSSLYDRIDPPTLTITNAAGEDVYSAALEYG